MKRFAICRSHYFPANSSTIVIVLPCLAGQHNVDLFLESVAHTGSPEFKSHPSLKTVNLTRNTKDSPLRPVRNMIAAIGLRITQMRLPAFSVSIRGTGTRK